MMKLNKEQLTERILGLRENAKVIMTLAAVLILLDVVFILRWQFVSLIRMFPEAKRLKTEIMDARSEGKLSSVNKNRVTDLQSDLDDLNKQISDEEGLPHVMESISKFADLSSVRIQQIRPLAEQKIVLKSSDKSGGVYVRQKISMTLIAGFHQLGRFIALLENSPVFLDVRQVEIRGGQQDYTKQVVTIVLEVVLKKA